MNVYTSLSLLFSLAVFIAYINHRFIKIQMSIAVMSGGLFISLALLLAHAFGFSSIGIQAQQLIKQLHFRDLLIDGMLSFLLFAGGLSIKIEHLWQRKWEISVLAIFSTIASTFVVAGLLYYSLGLLKVNLPFIDCLLFGALISPTDPIAVLAMCKSMQAPKLLEATIAGESLFNDGVGIVLFVTIYHITTMGGDTSFHSVLSLFAQQAIGGIFYGLLLGAAGRLLIGSIDDAELSILITIVIATAGYLFAQKLNVSGPLAMVVAGILIGNAQRQSAQSSYPVVQFWEIIDTILNTLLFLLIGFELLALPLNAWLYIASLLAIPLVLISRAVTVCLPISVFKLRKTYKPHTINILIWGGLRGGLAVALALSIPTGAYQQWILAMTYGVVAFSIIVQGLTIKPLVKKTSS